MTCLKRYFFLFLFALFGSFFISLSLNVNDSYAVSDLVISSSSSAEICSSCYESGYRFATFYFDSVDGSSSYSTLGITVSGSSFVRYLRFYPVVSSITIPVDSGSKYNSVSFGTSGRLVFSDTSPFSSFVPSGSLSISQNGTYDVSNYAEAVVNVPDTIIQGDYHDDLVSINQSILICGAILFVLYFFYCIYRMLIKSTGGK